MFIGRTQSSAEGSLERDVTGRLLDDAALQSEAALAAARLAVALLMLVRFFLIGAHASDDAALERTLLVVPAGLLAMGFSLEFLRRFRARRASRRWLAASVLMDALLCFVALLGNSLYPGGAYRGVLRSPDTALVLIVVAAAGFRLSIPLALVGGAVNLAATLSLVYLDAHLARVPIDYGWQQVLMWLIMMVAATAVATVSAWRTRSLAVRGARESLRRDRAQRDLTLVLEGHHDAQSVLSSMMLNAGQLVRALGDAERKDAVRISEQLTEDLDALASCVAQVKEQGGQALVSSRPLVETDFNASITHALPTLRDAVPDLEIEFDPLADSTTAPVAAGRIGLRRILENLLRNAGEGNGEHFASRARIGLERVGAEVRLTVEDDGPGWSAHGNDETVSEKPTGTGVGLSSVKRIAEASGGRVELGRSKLGGAMVVVRFPAAR